MKKSTLTTFIASAMAGAILLTACGNGGDDGDVVLRFTWWGSDHRHELTQSIIDDFTEEHPEITIEPEFADWSGYWDQLATQMAGGSGPDIIQLDDEYIREYADRGQLLELTDIDFSELDETIVEGGQAEGVQYAIPTGVNALVLMANPGIFDDAGVEIPDDTTWTWDDFEEVSAEIHDSTGTYALSQVIPQTLMVWARQQGGHLFTEEGDLGISVDQAEEYFETLQHWMEIGALPSASEMAEEESAVLEDSLIGTNQAFLGMSWTNQLPALSEASGTDLIPLRFPSPTGNPEDNGLWFKNTMLLGANAGTDHPEEAQLFIDYFINAEDAGMHNMMDRGLPTNLNVRETVMEAVEGQDLVAAELITELEDEITTPEPMLPLGFSGLAEAINLRSQDVYFGNQTPREAAEALVSEMESLLE